MVKYCISCGNQMKDNANFCGKCGTRIIGDYPNNVQTVGIPIKQYPKNIHTKRPWLKVVALAIFIAIALAIVFYAFLEINGFISPTSVSGRWEGYGTFTNNCDNPACEYVGKMFPPAVTLVLQQNGNNVAGTVAINIPQSQVNALISGSQCIELIAEGPISNGLISSTHLTFTDPGGNEWALNIVGTGLQGFVRNNDPGCLGLQSNNISLSKK